nr:nucleic acid-binding, OB-fold protein [Tanacetum cinerariifolium]
MTDYSLWEVIKNGNKILTKPIGSSEQTYEPTTAEEKQDRRNEMKSRGTLLMALPNKDQMKFHSYQDAKLLMEAIEKSTSSTNKADTTTSGVSTAHTQRTTVNSTSVDNLSDAMIYAFLASQPNTPQLAKEDLEQIDPDDLEEIDLHWEMAMLTIRARRFMKRTCGSLDMNGQRIVLTRQRQRAKVSETTIASLKIGQENCILKAKVYRKWVSKSVPEMKELTFCCILMDRENNAIQVNMEINNIDYFVPLLKPRVAYRFSDFICEKTKPYQQKLANEISLKFKKITKFETLTGKESEFRDHHFKFIAYNQLPSRVPYRDKNSKMVYPILTDYLVCVRSISDVLPSGDVSMTQKYRRKVDIENVKGNITEFTMWDDMAKQFKKEEIQKLPPPVIIVVSSC